MTNVLFAFLLASCLPASSPAQLLQGDWVVQAQTRIHELRKGNVRVIVLGRDRKPAADASVTISQVRHDFPLGVLIHDPAEIELITGEPAGGPVLRAFNAVSLDGLTAWPRMQPQPDADGRPPGESLLKPALAAADARGLRVRFGGVVSADPGLLPDWAAALPDADLVAAIEARVRRAAALAPRVDAFDLYTHALNFGGPSGGGGISMGGVTQKLGRAGLRRLFHLAHVTSGGRAQIALRVEDALIDQRIPDMLQRLRAMREAFVPIDAIALGHRAGGIVTQAAVDRTFRLLEPVDLPVILAPLEIGGASESSAAVNVETILRLAFAAPPVRGIYLSGLHEADVADPAAALLHDDGTPTEPGQMLDNLFRKLWWTDDAFVTDELGNVNARVFAGNHRITATLPDGTTLETLVHVPTQPIDELPMIVLLEP